MNNYLLLFIISSITVTAGCTLQEIDDRTTNNVSVTGPQVFLNYCQSTSADIYTTHLYNCSFYTITRDERSFTVVNKLHLKPQYPLIKLSNGFLQQEQTVNGATIDINELLNIPAGSGQEFMYSCTSTSGAAPPPCTVDIYYYYDGQSVKLIRTKQEFDKVFLPLENSEAVKEYITLTSKYPNEINSIDVTDKNGFFIVTINEGGGCRDQIVKQIKMLRDGTATEISSKIVKPVGLDQCM